MIRSLGYSQGAIRVNRQVLPYLVNMPEAPAETVQFRGWVSDRSLLTNVRVLMTTVNTNGNYWLRITNSSQGLELLESDVFDMNTISNDVITSVPIIGNIETKTFESLDRWIIEVESDSSSFNGEGIYIELVFEVI